LLVAPAHDLAREEIEHHRQVEPSLGGLHDRDVGRRRARART
jgi:hypothetical protein